MAKKDKKGYWIDGRGRAVPPKYINKIDKKRDALVERLIKSAKDINARLGKYKIQVNNEFEKFLKFVEEEYDVDEKTEIGNKTLSGFSHNYKVEIRLVPFYDFDEKLAIAREVISSCIDKWMASRQIDVRIKMLIDHAFMVDQKGYLDKSRIMALRSLQIDDADWKKAMLLIADSLKIHDRKAYIGVYEKDDEGKWQGIALDLARV